jgi:hypothetical protein
LSDELADKTQPQDYDRLAQSRIGLAQPVKRDRPDPGEGTFL